MTKAWEDFEKLCTEHLKNTFGNYAQFTNKGGKDSTKSDIEVTTKKGDTFYIEAKHCPAQCGQFVLLPNIETKNFDYSDKNITPINEYSSAIIDYMNLEFEAFKEAGTKGRNIGIKNYSEIFAGWIKNYYESKRTKYFITNGYKIYSIDDIANIFDISATYRVKRSGSNNVGYSKMPKVETYIKNNYNLLSTYNEKTKLFATSTEKLDNNRFILDATEYMFSERENSYEIRKLSNTFNANVIFSIEFTPKIEHISNEKFIDMLTK